MFIDFSAKEKLEIVQSERVASTGGRKGGLGGIPPALQILGEISSNFFERTPHFVMMAINNIITYVYEKKFFNRSCHPGCNFGYRVFIFEKRR